MSTYHCRDAYLRPDYKHSIIERDEHGAPLGAYTGYFNHRSHIVSLYPDYRHPLSMGKRLPVKKISDLEVRCEGTSGGVQRAKVTPSAEGYPSSVSGADSFSQRGNQGIKSQTSGAVKDACKQIKMKF